MHFSGGVRVAAGDINGVGFADVITAAGPGGGHVKVFSGSKGGLLTQFMADATAFTGGVYVAAGDVNNDGHADVITGAGAGGGPHVKVFSGLDGSLLRSFMPFDPGFMGGVRVGAFTSFGNDGHVDILVATGPGTAAQAKVLDGMKTAVLDSFFVQDPRALTGVFIRGH